MPRMVSLENLCAETVLVVYAHGGTAAERSVEVKEIAVRGALRGNWWRRD